MVELKEKLNILWDKLPIDTVIATMLDPRTKWLEKIPADEIKEALHTLKNEFLLEVRNNGGIYFESEEPLEKDVLSIVMNDLNNQSRQRAPIQVWKQEINFYQSLPRASFKQDPLLWWKLIYHF